MSSDKIVVAILIGISLAGIIAVTFLLGFSTRNLDNGSEIQKQIGIYAGITAIVTIILAVASYFYFSTNTNYMTPFLLIMVFVNMFLSVLSVSISTLSVMNV